jgi:hypothetical protein
MSLLRTPLTECKTFDALQKCQSFLRRGGRAVSYPKLGTGTVAVRVKLLEVVGSQPPPGPWGNWPLCAIEIATPTSEAAISTDQKMIAM